MSKEVAYQMDVKLAVAGFIGGLAAYHVLSKLLARPDKETEPTNSSSDPGSVTEDAHGCPRAASARAPARTVAIHAGGAQANGTAATRSFGDVKSFQLPGAEPFKLTLQLVHEDGSDPSELELAQDKFKDAAYMMALELSKRAETISASPAGGRGAADTLSSLMEHPTAFTEKVCAKCTGLSNALFVGHKAVDLDSVASAVGAAELYGGIACRADGGVRDLRSVNGEIDFACRYSDLESLIGSKYPPYWEDVEGHDNPDVGVVIVDHNNPEQMPGTLGQNIDRIVGCFDHHNIQSQFATKSPVLTDIRPWGSCSTIIAHNFIRLGRPLKKQVARLLLCGILSDTINMTASTTTDADRYIATLLTFIGQVDHVNMMAKEQFRAKTSRFTELDGFDMCRADGKAFQTDKLKKRFAWATLELSDPDKDGFCDHVLAKAVNILCELRTWKEDTRADYAFLSVVDCTNGRCDILLCGGKEVALAKVAFGDDTCCDELTGVTFKGQTRLDVGGLKKKHGGGGLSAAPGVATAEGEERFFKLLQVSNHHKPEWTLMDGGGRGSRKKDFVPVISGILDSGWEPTKTIPAEQVPAVRRGCACNLDNNLLCQTHSEFSSASLPSTLPSHFTCTEVKPGRTPDGQLFRGKSCP